MTFSRQSTPRVFRACDLWATRARAAFGRSDYHPTEVLTRRDSALTLCDLPVSYTPTAMFAVCERGNQLSDLCASYQLLAHIVPQTGSLTSVFGR